MQMMVHRCPGEQLINGGPVRLRRWLKPPGCLFLPPTPILFYLRRQWKDDILKQRLRRRRCSSVLAFFNRFKLLIIFCSIVEIQFVFFSAIIFFVRALRAITRRRNAGTEIEVLWTHRLMRTRDTLEEANMIIMLWKMKGLRKREGQRMSQMNLRRTDKTGKNPSTASSGVDADLSEHDVDDDDLTSTSTYLGPLDKVLIEIKKMCSDRSVRGAQYNRLL